MDSEGVEPARDYSAQVVRRTLAKYATLTSTYAVAADLVLRLVEVENAYGLLDRMVQQEARGHRGERFPYWAEVWPAALALARWLAEARTCPPRRTLELGCGVGLVGISLARMGWRVQATDFVEDALIFATHNARLNGAAARHSVSYLDWRNPVGRPCDCLVASDVAYERRNLPYLVRLLRCLLVPGGVFYLGDPGRRSTRCLVEVLGEQGFGHVARRLVQPWRSGDVGVDIHVFRRPDGR
ncbi:MAG: methyltransferase domain-containing protein [Candidatus Latescibacterota bacterium]